MRVMGIIFANDASLGELTTKRTSAINTLQSLRAQSGRHVGIISHVEELQERIPEQIQVRQEGNNSFSTVHVVPEEE